MARVLVVTSGKGGVGKTTSTAALGAALARTGERVAVIDFDVAHSRQKTRYSVPSRRFPNAR